MKRLSSASCIVVGAAITATAFGHHASNLEYDQEQVGTVRGVVDDVFWANPHIHVYLTVATEGGSTEIWDIEGPNLTSLNRRGVTREAIQIGDEIEVTGTLGRDGAKRIWAQSIMKSDGTPVMAAPR